MLVNTGDSCGTKHTFLSVLLQAYLQRNIEPTTLLHFCPNIYLLKAAFLYHKIPLFWFEKQKQQARWSNEWKKNQLLLVHHLLFTSNGSEISKVCRTTTSIEWVIRCSLVYPKLTDVAVLMFSRNMRSLYLSKFKADRPE